MPCGHRELSKAVKPTQLLEQLVGETAGGKADMDDLVPPDRTAQLAAG